MSRNLNFCFTKIKSPQHPLQENPPFLFNNYNSLFTADSNSDSDSDSASASAPDITTVFASRRFFFSSPGRSNSIIDSSSSSIASTSSSSASLNQPDVIAVPTDSPDPFMDFRRSMQEMVEARGVHDVHQNWNYLHELLMCYLSLNPKSTHKFIVGAFADLLVTLMTRHQTPFPNGKRKISR